MPPIKKLKKLWTERLEAARIARWSPFRSSSSTSRSLANKENEAPIHNAPRAKTRQQRPSVTSVPEHEPLKLLVPELAPVGILLRQHTAAATSAVTSTTTAPATSTATAVASIRHSKNFWKRRAQESEAKREALSAQLSDITQKLKEITSSRNRHRKDKKALALAQKRAPGILERAVMKALSAEEKKGRKFRLKENGVIPEKVRQICRKLHAQCRVPLSRVAQVINTVLRGAGIEPVGSIDRRSVRRAVGEGKIAATLQIAVAAAKARDNGGGTCSGFSR